MSETTSSNTKNYFIQLNADNNTYDWDELECILDQILAIRMGLTSPIKVFSVDESPHILYEWKNPAFDFLNDPKEDMYKPGDGSPILRK